ncbi:transglycosylase domain-containing protein [Streptomyces sp. BG9H]|uniref:Transglycosylase domain-containing protein n=1 Tax=Streptomyces anatolicus TaxID=2675858 RepID=A0ABS6YVB1_9ACTN|nr:transglycosylase family protein [Streptomyces anatolicus]MBW5425308.1 transglycosylase domain-containing protein [Streptomyces anatolicus]
MLSGNGRHRRPRQAPALIVAAGVAGSAIAIPLLGATSASAAETVTWDKLAQCESGGAWSANPGNGYYGGLQLSQEAWEQHGGLDYAPSADQASKSQQIAVAEKILDAQGPKAWPSCAPIAGLTDGGAAADVDPGGPVLPEPSDSTGTSGGEKSTDKGEGEDKGEDKGEAEKKEKGEAGAGKAAGSADPADDTSGAPGSSSGDAADAGDTPGSGDASREKNHDESGKKGKKGSPDGTSGAGRADGKGDPDGSGKSGQNGTTSPGSDDSATGRHRGGSADDGRATGGESGSGGDRPGRHASRGDARTEKVADGTYTVRSGDNLSAIADDHGVEGGWHGLYKENKKTVGADPDLILPGQSLDLGEKRG